MLKSLGIIWECKPARRSNWWWLLRCWRGCRKCNGQSESRQRAHWQFCTLKVMCLALTLIFLYCIAVCWTLSLTHCIIIQYAWRMHSCCRCSCCWFLPFCHHCLCIITHKEMLSFDCFLMKMMIAVNKLIHLWMLINRIRSSVWIVWLPVTRKT